MKCLTTQNPVQARHRALGVAGGLFLLALMSETSSGLAATEARGKPSCSQANTVTAKVVALEQVYYYNRFGSFNPSGMMYALRRDVVDTDTGAAIPLEPDKAADVKLAGNVQLRPDKRPRPLVLRANEGDCLRVTFTNLLRTTTGKQDLIREPSSGDRILIDAEEPATRRASMHVNGLNLVDSILSDGSNVGRNQSSLADPGETRTYTWYAKQEGGYLLYSMAGPAGGEGDGGQLGLGLFGAVNVQPAGAKWYRSQVNAEELAAATINRTRFGQPRVNYDATFTSGLRKGEPILAMLDHHRELIYTDLNAVIDVRPRGQSGSGAKIGEDCEHVTSPGSVCGKPYREFTTIFHDEVTAIQAYPELDDEANPLHALRDGMAINYGASGLGAMVLANRKRVGPAANCTECKLEEFFLTSWANGDPAMVVERDADNHVQGALYPDDPSNVHHSYIGDPVRFRNMHAGPKETHVFHLHAHQWVQDKHDSNSVYLDSQTISPGSVFSYEVHYGGSGNRNFTVGDSIFHCHLYPHFAQGMWELWRSHDVFEAGTRDRNLPDGEIADGTPNPAVVPLPRTPMPRMPTPDMKGYPFFIAGSAGHRPPQPPLDLDRDPVTHEVSDGGLPRHRFEDATVRNAVAEIPSKDPGDPACQNQPASGDLYDKGKASSACIAGRVRALNADPQIVAMAQKLATARLRLMLPNASGNDGTPEELRAMDFHAGKALVDGIPAIDEETRFGWKAKGYPSCEPNGQCDTPAKRTLFHVNGSSGPQPGAPYANPCPQEFDDAARARTYRVAYVQFDMTVNKSGWHDPQARIAVLEQDVKATFSGARPAEPLFFRARSGECVIFKATNLVPSILNVDDFQVFSPTDVLGQHIHLVKFDVTSSDGSGNGWNYEDGTLSADEVRERIAAYNRYQQSIGATDRLTPKVHRMFSAGNMAGDERGLCPPGIDPLAWDSVAMAEQHPFCGAQTTVQRWWTDPLLNAPTKAGGKDRTLLTVFTHDHFGPSSHQHHGLYAALVVEPAGSVWERINGSERLNTRTGPGDDGGPTSYAANIITPKDSAECNGKLDAACVDKGRTAREFNLAFADYALVYTAGQTGANLPVNPTNRVDGNLPSPTLHSGTPSPEGISTKDPGTMLINYRNEPIPLRIGERKTHPANAAPRNPLSCMPLPDGSQTCTQQKSGDQGDMANVFSSDIHKWQGEGGKALFTETIGSGRGPGDPATPLLMAFAGDRVQIRLIQGAQEENHIFNMHGVKWLSQPASLNSGYMNAQPIGISEHFEFNVDIHPVSPQLDTDYLYSSTATDNLWDGQWGLLRAFKWDSQQPFLARLPSNPAARAGDLLPAAGSACPSDSPQRRIWVTAGLARDVLETGPNKADGVIEYNNAAGLSDPHAILFVRTKETFKKNPKDPSADQKICNIDHPDPALRCFNKRYPEPLILRASAGECLFVTLTNNLPREMPDTWRHIDDPKAGEFQRSWSYNSMPPTGKGFNFNQIASSNRVSLHPQLVAVNGFSEDGSFVGNNEDSTAAAEGGQKVYHWYAGDFSLKATRFSDGRTAFQPSDAPIEFGAIALRDMGDAIKHSSHGAIGALVIEPKGAQWKTDLEQNRNDHSTASATVEYVDANRVKRAFRDFVVVYQDDVSLQQKGTALPNLRNADDAEDTGHKAFNYRSEPLWAHLGSAPTAEPGMMGEYDFSDVFSSCVSRGTCQPDPAHGRFCDPATPIFRANAGDGVRFRIVHAAGHPRNHGFTLSGHDWLINPWVCDTNSTVMGWNQYSEHRIGSAGGIGPARHLNVVTTAGGDFHVPGDYLYRSQEGFMFAGGLWGLFRVDPEMGGWHNSPPRRYCGTNR